MNAFSKVQAGVTSSRADISKNFVANTGGYNPSISVAGFPAYLNDDQYPTGTIPGNLAFTINWPSNITTSDVFVLAWTGVATKGGSVAVLLNHGTVINVGASFVIGSTAFTTGVAGTNGYIEFTQTAPVTFANVGITFESGSTFTGFSKFIICRKSDYNSIVNAASATDLLDANLVAQLKGLNLRSLRPMSLTDPNDGNNATQFRYRHNWQSSLCYGGRYLQTCWAGGPGTTGTNVPAPTTLGSYVCSGGTDTPAVYTAGEVIQGVLARNYALVTGAANNGSGNVRLTLDSIVGIANGKSFIVIGVLGTTEANGTWAVSNVGAGGNTIDISVAFVHVYTSGGFVSNPSQGINVAGRGVVPMLTASGNKIVSVSSAPSSTAIDANNICTLIYDDILAGYICSVGAYLANVPIETQIALANAAGCPLWYNTPPHITYRSSTMEPVDSVTQTANALLSCTYGCYLEPINEVWNNFSGFQQTSWASVCGVLLGIGSAQPSSDYSFYSFLLIQYATIFKSVWGRRSDLKIVCAGQGAEAGGSNFKTWKLNSTTLAPNGTHTGTGNALWNSYTGSADYTQSPNRCVDLIDIVAYAVYQSGAQCSNGDSNYRNVSGTGLTTGGPSFGAGSAIAGLVGAADAFASGDTANALAWLDWDFRQGTNNGTLGGATGATLLNFANSVYPGWETCVALYDAGRPAGKSNLAIELYEGAMEAVPPSTGECTTLGISTTYGGATGKIGNLLTAYKSSSLFAQLVKDQFDQFFAAGSHSKGACWFLINGGNQWSMTEPPGDAYSAMWQSYVAVQHYNNFIRTFVLKT